MSEAMARRCQATRRSPAIGLAAPLAALVCALPMVGCRLPGATPRNVLASRAATERGLRALEEGRSLDAERELARAVEACDHEVDARRYYAEALWQRGALSEAWTQLEAAANLSPTDPQLRIRSGQLRLAMQDPHAAWTLAETALELDPRSPEAWILRGQVQRQLGRNADALADFLRASHYDPNHREALRETAETYLALAQPARALAVLQSLADTYPPGAEPTEVLDRTAEVLAQLERHDDAAAQWSASLSRAAPTAQRCHAYAESLWKAGRVGEARAATLKALSLSPDHQASRELLARMGDRGSQAIR